VFIIPGTWGKFKVNLFRGWKIPRSFDCVVRISANDSAQDDRVWGAEGRKTTTEADPCGMTNKRTGNGKDEMRGSLHCGGKSAASGRDDASLVGVKKRQQQIPTG
jgi:hypothetical protein